MPPSKLSELLNAIRGLQKEVTRYHDSVNERLLRLECLMSGCSQMEPDTIRDQVMRSGLFRAVPVGLPAVDDVFWVLFCEYLREQQRRFQPLDAAQTALTALRDGRFIIQPEQVYSLMKTLASRQSPYFGIATDADINVVLGQHPSGRGARPAPEEIEDARYFLFDMPLERDYRSKIRRLFWLSEPSILNRLDKDLKASLAKQVTEMGANFGLRIGKSAENCGYYANVAKGELDVKSGYNTIQFGEFSLKRRNLEQRLDHKSQHALLVLIEKW